MINRTGKKSWKKQVIICWTIILFFSSGQITAQETIEVSGKETMILEATAVLSDPEPELLKENREVTEDGSDGNISDEKTNQEDNLTTDQDESTEESTDIAVTALDINNVVIRIEPGVENKTQFMISTVGCAGKTGIGKVMFPTWSERKGQDDIHWYEGKLNSNGEYSFTVDIKDHGFETGDYHIHSYIYGLKGELAKNLTNTFSLGTPNPTITVGEVLNNEYKVRITGASNPQGVTGISFPTWSQIDGQDDLRWESGTYVGNDTWEATISIINYKRSYDTFITHAYVKNKEGQQTYSGDIEQVISNPFLQEPMEIKVQQDSDISKFSISTQNCSDKTGIKDVVFAVWSNRNGQDELKWYNGELGPDGEFYAYVDIENHGFETGSYIIHAYLRGIGGESIAFANSEFTKPSISPIIEYDKAVLNNTFKMRIKNVANENGVTGIMFPTWSRSNGQDDLRWEQATYIGNHTWEATINLQNYNIIVDEFISHAYLVDKSGKMVFAKDSSRKILQNTATIYGFFNYPLDKNYKPNASDPTDWFGPRWGDIHEGIDIPAPYYAPCYAVGNGVVEKAGYFMGYGRYVRIRTTDRYGESVSFFYGHLQEINVGVGQPVSKGQKVGSVGGSGYNAQRTYIDNAYGPHLHFGAIANADDACVNPEIWIDFHNPFSNAN
ncbi:GBS Bsp-like repeat-containing protein [Acetobacterium malicum]|uniref:GBS Bsp-like repeat-containing protein n=1 Tax=Acetobacterium malicum TaxID=52692 RepID=UPI003594387F